MKYPFIGKGKYGSIVLFNDRFSGFAIIHANRVLEGHWSEYWNESTFINITHEYLSNTWGVVESKEHAEFIIKLAELHGFVVGINPVNAMCFEFSVDSVNFYGIASDVFAHNEESKLITIPLPPKAKEWPQVGDKVCWGIASSGVIKSLSDGFAWIKRDDNDYSTVYTSSLKKPKSKQDLLIEELQTKLCNNNAVDNYILACDIINGEIEGLSYE